MKRILFVTLLILSAISTAFAYDYRVEDTIPLNDTTRPYASKLGQNWFVTLDGSINWWQGSDRIPTGNFTKLNGPSFGGGLSVGKWITHNLALRVSYNINGGKSFINGRHPGLAGIQFLYGDKPTPITVTYDGKTYDYYETNFIYHHLHGDVMISPIDLIEGYYHDRIYTPVIYVGMGVGCVSEYVFVTQSLVKGESRNFELSFTAGLMNKFRLNNYFDLDVNLGFSGQRWTCDSWTYEYGGTSGMAEEPRPRAVDLNYQASIGFSWYIGGRIYEYPHNYVPTMKENTVFLEQIVHDTVFTPIYVGDTLTEIVSFPLSIFFHRDKYELMSGRDLVNLREIAEVAKAKGWKVRLRGSCDSATASPAYNQRLSENRCRRIMMYMLEFGVPEEQIILAPVGGVKELDPTEYDRRVLIELVKQLK